MIVINLNSKIFIKCLLIFLFLLGTPPLLFSQSSNNESHNRNDRYYGRDPKKSNDRGRYDDHYNYQYPRRYNDQKHIRYGRDSSKYYGRRYVNERRDPATNASKDEVQYESEITVPHPECLQYLGAGRGKGVGSYQLHFYNSCPQKIWAKVCVEERQGEFKLHKSVTRIPKYGRFYIFTYEGRAPNSVHWSSGPGVPPDPGQCFQTIPDKD